MPLVLHGRRWEMDLDATADALDNRTRLFMFCNPQNPTGRIYQRDELVELARFCERHDLLICSDEIHCDAAARRRIAPAHPDSNVVDRHRRANDHADGADQELQHARARAARLR